MTDTNSSTSVTQPIHSYLDPYFLHSGDSTNLILVTDQFNGENYKKWKRCIRLALLFKNKLGFVSGSLSKPNSSHADHQRWILVDYTMRCWLLSSIHYTISETLMYASSAKDLWYEINERYGDSDNLMFYELQSELHSLKQVSMSLAVYYGKLKSIWEDMSEIDAFPECSCGVMSKCSCAILKHLVEFSNRHKLVQFLMGLDSSYDTVHTTILSSDPLPALNSVYNQLLRVEKQQRLSVLSTLPIDSTALAAVTPVYSGPHSSSSTCHVQSSLKHNKRYLTCTFRGKRGHDYAECFKRLKKVPDWYKELQEKRSYKSSAYTVDVDDPLMPDSGILPLLGLYSQTPIQLTPALLESLFHKYVSTAQPRMLHAPTPNSDHPTPNSDHPPPSVAPDIHFVGTLHTTSPLITSDSLG
ncbi:hypothetical protein RND81_04G055600 [Saponaria officinalis]|uniref:Retrotransposon Copia-like N-terminal domain-containing protein n=1 Tax=Saponaria officinalis TaxID=3572 RepID=A0AAW1LD44_SAPOF